MRADTFVLCNSQYLIKLMIDLKVYPVILRLSTSLIGSYNNPIYNEIQIKNLITLNGVSTNNIKTFQPVVGKSIVFNNLFYMFGLTTSDLNERK